MEHLAAVPTRPRLHLLATLPFESSMSVAESQFSIQFWMSLSSSSLMRCSIAISLSNAWTSRGGGLLNRLSHAIVIWTSIFAKFKLACLTISRHHSS